MVALGHDVFCHPTGSDDMGCVAKRGQQTIQKTVDHGSGAIEDAALHTFQRVTPYQMLRFFNKDGGQLGSPLTEGIERGLDTRDDEAA